MGIVVIGLSHKTAPVTTREKVAFSREAIPGAVKQFAELFPVEEAVILSTCNRVELFAQVQNDDAILDIRAFLHAYHGLPQGVLDQYLYEYKDAAAVRHVFRMASGLDSMVIGESQILGQMRDAYNTADQAGCLGGNLRQLMLRAFHAARQVRTRSGISVAGWSVSRAAVELAQRTLGHLTDRTVLVVGAGKMSELTTRHLRHSGAVNVLVTNRTYERAARVAARFDGEAVAFDDLPSALERSDIVISSAGLSSGYVIQRDDVERALRKRSGRAVLFIDIAVPRNVDPAIASVENAYLCDIDGLQGVVASHGRDAADFEAAERMIDRAVDAFCHAPEAREIGPLIITMTNRMESIGVAELERHIGKLSSATPQDRYHLEAMVKRIAKKILHPLIVHLKRQTGSSSETTGYVDVLAEAFSANANEESAPGTDRIGASPGVSPQWRDLQALALPDRRMRITDTIHHPGSNASARC